MNKHTVGVAILTLNAEKLLPSCLPPILACSLKPKIIIIDSSSSDHTVQIARKMGVNTVVIPQNEFNHGLTREAARKLLDTDIVVMMTPDAFAESSSVLNDLVEPLMQGRASLSYARQIPHRGACILESFPRQFNYPAESQIRSIADVDVYGAYTFFCSDSCAAYLNSALDQIGGFQETLFGEDTLAAAKLLLAGHKIAYQAHAVVRHSHRYTLKQEFKRHFDIGIFRKQNQALFDQAGSVNSRGKNYAKMLFLDVWKKEKKLIYYAFIQTVTKWIGYQIGFRSLKAPLWWKRALSSQPSYWRK